ncbi:TauD/TfdA family dioxygenase [Rugamonas sp. A1-17]|nr:TauD/TfdA family dioxygenase [Rugamonas sp. A1-17]
MKTLVSPGAMQMGETAQVAEDRSWLEEVAETSQEARERAVLQALKKDHVALVRGLSAEAASELLLAVAQKCGLEDGLDLQTAFASSLGHRENVGRYYMTVNKRSDYQFVCPHSEGNSFSNFQLASFYCYENSTDGGETILFHTNQAASAWQTARERVNRAKVNGVLTPGQIRQMRASLRLNMPDDALAPDDEILSERVIDAQLSVFKALARPRQTYSVLLQRQLYGYWNSIESTDADSADEFRAMLQADGLLRLPAGSEPTSLLDDEHANRIRRFGSKYADLFSSKITHKLVAGDFVILNNVSWAHSVANWTPGSGQRQVVAAFA